MRRAARFLLHSMAGTCLSAPPHPALLPPRPPPTPQLPLKADGVEARAVHKQLLGFIQRSDPR